MSGIVVIGTQWGDEGKGKIVDFLAKDADIVVRYQGGNNAGHTVVLGNKTFKFHLIPSGALYKEKMVMLGNGMVIDPVVLCDEIKTLKENSHELKNIRISEKAHVIMNYHKIFDLGKEVKRGKGSIGTTGRGIGPSYAEKINRTEAIRMFDFVSENFNEKIKKIVNAKIDDLIEYGIIKSEKDAEKYAGNLFKDYQKYSDLLKSFVGDISVEINNALDEGKTVIFEGAQGTLLDIDHGTYPFVTASNPTAGGACTGTGVGPRKLNRIIGIVKAYTTRVGNGPFPTELIDKTGEMMREKGGEFGTTTGRPRRCGWLDLMILKYSKMINSLDELAVTKLDVLSGIDPLKICIKYKIGNKTIEEFPSSSEILEKCKPVYITMNGWKELSKDEWNEIAKGGYYALPREAKEYLKKIEEFINLPIKLVGVGPARDQIVSML